jgi:hypothetical protein
MTFGGRFSLVAYSFMDVPLESGYTPAQQGCSLRIRNAHHGSRIADSFEPALLATSLKNFAVPPIAPFMDTKP